MWGEVAWHGNECYYIRVNDRRGIFAQPARIVRFVRNLCGWRDSPLKKKHLKNHVLTTYWVKRSPKDVAVHVFLIMLLIKTKLHNLTGYTQMCKAQNTLSSDANLLSILFFLFFQNYELFPIRAAWKLEVLTPNLFSTLWTTSNPTVWEWNSLLYCVVFELRGLIIPCM